MTLLEQFVRRCAKRTIRNGDAILITDGDPLLVAGFKALNWSDPYQDAPETRATEAATVRAPERAVLPDATGYSA